MQCDGQPHVYGQKFVQDFANELRKQADQHLCQPTYPEQLWFRALAAADERDKLRLVRELNSRDDANYFERQHICIAAATLLANRDGFSSAVHRSASGAIRHLVPEIHEFRTPEDGRRTRWQNERGQVERAKITARANGNGRHAS